LMLLAKASPLPFIATRGPTEENPWINSARFTDAFMTVHLAAFTNAVKDAIMQILQNSNVSREHWI
jgi:hypothetical protein